MAGSPPDIFFMDEALFTLNRTVGSQNKNYWFHKILMQFSKILYMSLNLQAGKQQAGKKKKKSHALL